MEKPILFNTEMVKAILEGRKTQTRRLIRPQPAGQLSYIMGGSHPGKWDYMSASEAKAWDVEESRICKQDDGRLWTPPCHADDLLYVRETWNYGYVDSDCKECCTPEYWFEELDWNGNDHDFLRGISRFWYLADEDEPLYGLKWKPSIHMPKEAARIWLKVTNVRCERLQDISFSEIQAEGMDMDEWYEYDEWQHSVGDGMGDIPVIFENPYHFFGNRVWDRTMKNLEQYEKYGWDANPWVWVIEFERMEGRHDEH